MNRQHAAAMAGLSLRQEVDVTGDAAVATIASRTDVSQDCR